MGRNLTTTLTAAGRRAQANFAAADAALAHASAERKAAMVRCYAETEMSVYDIAEIFDTSPSYVHNVLRAAGIEKRRAS